MHRPISTRTHGMIDYLWATMAGTNFIFIKLRRTK
jgi:hypothetical protein